MNENITVTGTVTGNINVAALTVDIGFVPREIEVFNATNLAQMKWRDTLTSPTFIKQVAAGTTTLPAAGLITFAGDDGEVALTGTVAIALAGATITGTGSAFLSQLQVGDEVRIGDYVYQIKTVDSETSATIEGTAFAVASGATAYRVNGRSAGFVIGLNLTDLNDAAEVLHYVARR